MAHDSVYESVCLNTKKYMKEWGVDMTYARGGSLAESPTPMTSPREIYLLKRSKGKHEKILEKPRVGFSVLV